MKTFQRLSILFLIGISIVALASPQGVEAKKKATRRYRFVPITRGIHSKVVINPAHSTVDLTTPKAGATYLVGDTVTVQWSSHAVQPANYLYLDLVSTDKTKKSALPHQIVGLAAKEIQKGSYQWTIDSYTEGDAKKSIEPGDYTLQAALLSEKTCRQASCLYEYQKTKHEIKLLSASKSGTFTITQ